MPQIDDHPPPGEQNSAYGTANPSTFESHDSNVTDSAVVTRINERISDSYPAAWNEVADIRVFTATPNEWTRLISWRSDMRRKGWKLLRVSTKENEMIAVFGRTREELMR